MGRQIPIVMTVNDENLFLEQIKSISDFIIIEYFAKSSEELFVDRFNEQPEGHWIYNLWNKNLKWDIEFGITETDKKLVYIKNNFDAPFIEFGRQLSYPLSVTQAYGRIYLNTSIKENLPYNESELIDTYNKMVKIIKKTSAGKINKNNWVTYFYPESWENYQKNIVK